MFAREIRRHSFSPLLTNERCGLQETAHDRDFDLASIHRSTDLKLAYYWPRPDTVSTTEFR